MSRPLAVVAALAVCLAMPLPAAAAPAPAPVCAATDTSSLCIQKRALDAVRSQLTANLATARAAQKQLTDSIAANDRQQEALRGRIADAQSQIQALDAEIDRDQQLIAALEQRISQERNQIRALARAVYFEPTSIFVLLASARSIGDVLTGTTDLVAAGSRASEIEAQIANHRAEVAAARDRSEAARVEQVRTRDSLTASVAKLADLQRQQADSANQLAVKIAQTQAESAALDRQSAALAALIAEQLQEQQEQVIADAMQRAWAQAQLWIAANPGMPGLSAGHSKRYRFVWPEPTAQITQGFGPTDLPLEPPYLGYPHFHTGIDLAAPEGTTVEAADDGVVAVVGDGTTGYGRFVILSHRDGLATLYGHLDQPLVHVGDQVIQGQPIGLEGSTGNSTGPHVHFELRSGGQPQDPSPLLPPGPPSAEKD